MGILTGSGGPAPMGEGHQQCKINYEKEIEKVKDQRERASRLKEAVMDYVRGSRKSDTLAQMIGELTFEMRELNLREADLITLMESEQEGA